MPTPKLDIYDTKLHLMIRGHCRRGLDNCCLGVSSVQSMDILPMISNDITAHTRLAKTKISYMSTYMEKKD